MHYSICIGLLFIAIIIRKIFNKDQYYKSINFNILIVWLFLIFTELIYSFIITKKDLEIYSTIVVGIIAICSIIVFPISICNIHKHTYSEIILNSKVFVALFFLFFSSTVVFLYNYINLIKIYGFHFNVINAYSDELIFGLWGYVFMIGISAVLMNPFVYLRCKNLMIFYILLIYGINPRRIYFFMCFLILLIQTLNVKNIKMKPSKVILPGLVFLIFFHFTQCLLNKSIYNSLSNQYSPLVARLYSIIIDPLIYIVGNISNVDNYLQLMPANTMFLEKSFYALYTLASNLGINQSPYLINPFIVNGLFVSNTIAFITYYISDGGVIYAFLITLLIMLFNEICSFDSVKFSKIFYPFALCCALLSFRQNDYILIYFYINLFIIFIVSQLFSKKRKQL